MTKQSAKILKIILLIALFICLLRFNFAQESTTGFEAVSGALFLAALAYLLMTLYGFTLESCGNYVLSAIVAVILSFIIIFGMNKLSRKLPWLTDEVSVIIISVLALAIFVKDIRYIKNSFSRGTQGDTPKEPILHPDATPFPSQHERDEEIRKDYKSNPQYVLTIANSLEEQWGRKPTYEEVMNFIDTLSEWSEEDTNTQ